MADARMESYLYGNALEEALAASGLAEGQGARSLAAWMLAQSVERGEPLPLDGDFPDLEGLRDLYRGFLREALEKGSASFREGLERSFREGAPQEAAALLAEYQGGLLPPDLEVLAWREEGGIYLALSRKGAVASADLLLRYGEGGLEILEGRGRQEAVASLLASRGGEAVLLYLQDELAASLGDAPGEEARHGGRVLLRGLAESARRMAEAVSQGGPLGELGLAHALPQEHLLIIDGLAGRQEAPLRALAEAAQALAEREEVANPLAEVLARWASLRELAPTKGVEEPGG